MTVSYTHLDVYKRQAIEPTKMPTQMPYIAISHLILEPKPKLPAIMDDKFPQMTPQIITFSTRIMLFILQSLIILGITPITSTNAKTPADTPHPAKRAQIDMIILLNILFFLYFVNYSIIGVFIMFIHLNLYGEMCIRDSFSV